MDIWGFRDIRIFTYLVGVGILLSLLLWPFGFIPTATLRVVFGMILLLGLPGYFAFWAIFDRKEVSEIERLGLVFVFSLVLSVVPVMLGDYFFKIPVTAPNIAMIILFVTFVCAGIAAFRHRRFLNTI